MLDVVSGLAEDDLYTPSFTVRGLNSFHRAKNLAEKRRGDARMKAMPINNKIANKMVLGTVDGASLSLIDGLEHSCIAAYNK